MATVVNKNAYMHKHITYVYSCLTLQAQLPPIQNYTFLDTSVMLPLVFIFLLFHLPLTLSSLDQSNCYPKKKPSIHKDGDVLITGFFPRYVFVKEGVSRDPDEF
jgi:hypothetical protein